KEKKGKIPLKTEVAKCATYVIDNNETELSDLPIVWYLYGRIPLMAVDVNANYQEEVSLKNSSKIQSLIRDFIKKNGDKKVRQINSEQHKNYNEEIYIRYDEIFELLNQDDIENSKLINLLQKFFIACPIDSEFPEVFDLTEKVISLIKKMDLVGLEFKKNRNKILLTLDSLWKFIAIYKFYKSITEGPNAKDKETTKTFYIGMPLEEKRRVLQESFSELNSEYLSKISEIDVDNLEIPEEVKEIRKIMEDWTGED
ncbi:MAG: hypothetical protein Q8P15_01540, partial [Nanoarchaeota archaeon]|nr:hypothetical protein [Nanoarchaeota archaeon]